MLINLFFSIFAAGLFSQGVLHYNLLYQIHGELVAVLLLLSFTRLMCVGSNMNLKRTTSIEVLRVVVSNM